MIQLCSPNQASSPTALALGSFDGLHAGHRKVIETVTKSAPGIPTVVSFWPHPREVLYGESRLRLDLPSEKTALLEPLGIQQLVLVPFNLELAALSAEVFVEQMLLKTLKARHIAIGENFRFGRNREGDAFYLKKLADKKGIEVSILPILEDSNGRMSSSRIRSSLSQGDLKAARELMGRSYKFCGKVVKGRGLGRKLGWPTANLQIDGRKFLPKLGVYAAKAKINNTNSLLPAVMNLGPQPTVDPNSPSTVEVHLLDIEQELVGCELTIEPIQRIRGQKRFESLKELSKQIEKDSNEARKILQTL